MSAAFTFEGKDLGLDYLMLLLGLIECILAGKGDGTTVGNLAAPVRLIGDTVDIDSAAGIGKVEAAILGIELADRSGKLFRQAARRLR